jgi:hypothetical protein
LLFFHFRPEKFFGLRGGLRRGERDRERARDASDFDSAAFNSGFDSAAFGSGSVSRGGEGDMFARLLLNVLYWCCSDRGDELAENDVNHRD